MLNYVLKNELNIIALHDRKFLQVFYVFAQTNNVLLFSVKIFVGDKKFKFFVSKWLDLVNSLKTCEEKQFHEFFLLSKKGFLVQI